MHFDLGWHKTFCPGLLNSKAERFQIIKHAKITTNNLWFNPRECSVPDTDYATSDNPDVDMVTQRGEGAGRGRGVGTSSDTGNRNDIILRGNIDRRVRHREDGRDCGLPQIQPETDLTLWARELTPVNTYTECECLVICKQLSAELFFSKYNLVDIHDGYIFCNMNSAPKELMDDDTSQGIDDEAWTFSTIATGHFFVGL